jgi:hypothetical protein
VVGKNILEINSRIWCSGAHFFCGVFLQTFQQLYSSQLFLHMWICINAIPVNLFSVIDSGMFQWTCSPFTWTASNRESKSYLQKNKYVSKPVPCHRCSMCLRVDGEFSIFKNCCFPMMSSVSNVSTDEWYSK